jgi:hypothetical protein
MGMRRRYKRSELFLVRVWTQGRGHDSSMGTWRGRVQRAGNGEAHQFEDWQGLLRVLSEMLEGPKAEEFPNQEGQTDE